MQSLHYSQIHYTAFKSISLGAALRKRAVCDILWRESEIKTMHDKQEHMENGFRESEFDATIHISSLLM
jgi:hypothetical protein